MRILRPLTSLVISSKFFSKKINYTLCLLSTNHQRFSSGTAKPSEQQASLSGGSISAGLNIHQDCIEKEEEEDTHNEDNIYDREFIDMTVEDFESLYKNDVTGTTRDRIETVLKEYEFHKYNSMGRVPSQIDIVDMERCLAEAPTPSTREKLFNYLYKREIAKRNESNKKKREKMEKLLIRQEKIQFMTDKWGNNRTGLLSSNGDIIYGLWHNSLFCRIPENKMKAGSTKYRLIQAAMFGKKLIFDWDFNEHMVSWVSRNAADQIQEAYGLNRYQYTEPFDIWFCNFNETQPGPSYLANKGLKNLYNGSMITVKNDCFTNYFDKSRLVYLSPNARERVSSDILKNDDIYIIGVYNDRGSSKPLTFRKAEALGIRCQSLPIDTHLAWQGGSKSLCVNHVTGILLEAMANGGDWRSALMKHIPERKLKPVEVLLEQEQMRKSKLVSKLKKRAQFSLREDLDWD